MPEYKEMLGNFNYKADTTQAIFDWFSRVISNLATLNSLKDMVFENLTCARGKNREELIDEFEGFFAEYRKELLMDFVSKYGEFKNLKDTEKR